jgi:hypothetical protein
MFLLVVPFPSCITALVYGDCALAQGELACVRGELFVLFELWIGGVCSLLEHCFFSDVLSRCPCLRGPRLALLQVILLFAFPLAFDRLLEFLLVVSFFSFSLWLPNLVCCQCTHQGGDGGPCVVQVPMDGRFLV